jgi:hypothetical protein
MSVNKLVGSLVGAYRGPVLVVGGAPSAPAELETLRAGGFDIERCVIVSANEHAIHLGLKPHFACVNDDVHHTLNEYQEPRLRKLMPDTMLLSRHWWADFRSPQLLACNSGLKAILYAAILGANPVVVIGIEHYREGLYFHPEQQGRVKKSNPNTGRSDAYFAKQTTQLREKLKWVPVRPVSGPLTQVWQQWDPKEQFPVRDRCVLEKKALDDAEDTRYVYVRERGYSFEQAMVPQHTVFAVTRFELLEQQNNLAIADASSWDKDQLAAAMVGDAESRRAEQDRLRRMIAKARSQARTIRRGIYDADLVRIIYWAEEGLRPEDIAKRSGLPKPQVEWLVEALGAKPKAKGLTAA